MNKQDVIKGWALGLGLLAFLLFVNVACYLTEL